MALALIVSSSYMGYAKKQIQHVRIKFATLAPKAALQTDVNSDLVSEMNKQLGLLEDRFKIKIEVTGYFGGVMGDDPQMVQKAKVGQLDLLGTTLEGLRLCAKNIDVLCMAYLIENYGQFDYVMNRNAAYINNLFYKEGWIPMMGIMSEGRHDLYLVKPFKKIKEMRSNLKAANYTGGPDNTFFNALKIPQSPISMSSMYPAFRTKSSNAAIIPAMFAVGMQLYTTLKYVIDPPIRHPVSAAILVKKKWDTFPWDIRVYMAVLQPIGYWSTASAARDMSIAFRNALLKHSVTEISLSPQELKAWKDPVIAYRESYFKNNPSKKDFYNRIVQSLKEYNSKNSIERQIFESDPTYASFYDRTMAVAKAMKKYYDTDSKTALLKLTEDRIIEKWRLYDWISYSEEFIKTGNPKKLKKWMKSFYITEVVDEIFSNHLDSVKRVLGSSKALKSRIEELLLNVETPMYQGFQRKAAMKKQEW